MNKNVIFGAQRATTKFVANMPSEREKYLISISRLRVEIRGKIITVAVGQSRIGRKKLPTKLK